MAPTPAKRLQRAKRLMNVQEQMRRAAELDLAATRGRIDAVETDRRALLASLTLSTHGDLLLESTNKRLRSLAAQATELEQEVGRQVEAVRECGMAEKRAETQVERVSRICRDEAERVEALDRLDSLSRPREPGL